MKLTQVDDKDIIMFFYLQIGFRLFKIGVIKCFKTSAVNLVLVGMMSFGVPWVLRCEFTVEVGQVFFILYCRHYWGL
jgi:hypothetical protein